MLSPVLAAFVRSRSLSSPPASNHANCAPARRRKAVAALPPAPAPTTTKSFVSEHVDSEAVGVLYGEGGSGGGEARGGGGGWQG